MLPISELMVHKRGAKIFYNKLQDEAIPNNDPHFLSMFMDFM